ncbi:serine/arginine repetitive matrix protein 1-like [Penaeus chinensis]|uniref:serine/arginine repetitive matrix protein 1-like n=1 Tax=Penaeus chinensis TaxID=139456 RepID=UPI001FB7F761|nr:serine/arginine repetitive matrix protein 1-like [Penaeus chinensis]
MPSLRARVQPQESSRWVEGKGSGCLRHFFPLFRPSAPKAEPTSATTSQPPASSNRPSSPAGQHTSSSNQAPLRAGGSHATLTDPSSVSQRPTSPPSSPLQDSETLSKEPSSLIRVPSSYLLQASPPKQRTDDPVYTTCFSIAVPPSILNASVPPVNGLFKNTLNLNKDLTLTPNTLSPTADIPSDPKEDPAASPFLGRSSPPPRKDSPHTGLEPPPGSADSPPLARNSLPVQPGRPPADTARWVMGKGAGRLQGFAAKPASSHKKDNSRRASLSLLPQSKKSSVKTKKKSRKSKKKKRGVVEMSRRSSLQRSQSDTALYLPPTHHNNYAHQTLKLKSNQVIIFRDRAATKNGMKGSRPSTPLPSIILTLPEAQRRSRRLSKQENDRPKSVIQGKGNMTKVPSLPNIRSQYVAPRSFSSYRRDSTGRPTTPKAPRRRLSNASQNPTRQKSKPVISTLRRTATSQNRRHGALSADTLNAANRQRFTKSSRASRRRIPEQVHPEPQAPEIVDSPPTRLRSATSAVTATYIQNLRKERQDRYAHLLASATGRANTPRPGGRPEDDLSPLSLGEQAKTPTFSRSISKASFEQEFPGRSQDLALVHGEYVH